MADAPPPVLPAAIPLGERLALAFGAGARADALAALAEVEHEILASARHGIDHGVAHVRLEWWRGEIEQLASGTPRHPAARRLHVAAGAGPRYARLAELLRSAEMAVLGYAPDGRAELLAELDRSHGTRAALRAEILVGGQHPRLEDYACALGRGLGLAGALATDDATLLGAVPRTEARALAIEELDRALALEAPFTARQAHGLIRARLAREGLDRVGGELPALRQWWLAWRTARRALGSVP